ncbi:MAG: hypothetical protein ABIO57_03235 [Candidatus Paceibacterota bacterium]
MKIPSSGIGINVGGILLIAICLLALGIIFGKYLKKITLAKLLWWKKNSSTPSSVATGAAIPTKKTCGSNWASNLLKFAFAVLVLVIAAYWGITSYRTVIVEGEGSIPRTPAMLGIRDSTNPYTEYTQIYVSGTPYHFQKNVYYLYHHTGTDFFFKGTTGMKEQFKFVNKGRGYYLIKSVIADDVMVTSYDTSD